jgi:hypothetical protein
MRDASLQNHPGIRQAVLPGPICRMRMLRIWVNGSKEADTMDHVISQVLCHCGQGRMMVLDSYFDHWYTTDKTSSVL